jgi:hypothetical protein
VHPEEVTTRAVEPDELGEMAGGEDWWRTAVAQPQKSINMPELPAKPSIFEPDPPVIADPLTARLVWMMMNQQPDLRKQVSKVQMGPTAGAMHEMMKTGSTDYSNSGLAGVFDTRNKEISINPMLNHEPVHGLTYEGHQIRIPSILETLVHEIEHAKGGDEETAQGVEADVRGGNWMYNNMLRRAMER